MIEANRMYFLFRVKLVALENFFAVFKMNSDVIP